MNIAMVPSEWIKEAKKNAGWLIALGVLGIVVGVFAIASPHVAGMWVSMVVGGILLVAGAGNLVAAFKAGSFGSGLLGFAGGALTSVAGLMMFFRPLFGMGVLTMLLAFYLFFDGISGITVGFRVRPESGWGWLAFSGALALLLGVMIWRQWPLSGMWAIGTLVGIHILLRGWSLVAIGLAARRGLSAVQEASRQG